MKKKTITIALITVVIGGFFYEYNNKEPLIASSIKTDEHSQSIITVKDSKNDQSNELDNITIGKPIVFSKITTHAFQEKKYQYKETIALESRTKKLYDKPDDSVPDGWTLRETLTGTGHDSFFKPIDFVENEVTFKEHTPVSYVSINIDSILKLSVGDTYILPEINGVQHKVSITEIDDRDMSLLVIRGDIKDYNLEEAVELYYHINGDQVVIYIDSPDENFYLTTANGKGAIYSADKINEKLYNEIEKQEKQDQEEKDYVRWINDHRSEPANRAVF